MSSRSSPAAAGASVTDHRHGPRRRGPELVEAIFDAVLAELTEHGYDAVTMDSVAQRAHTGKASLYRRWPTRVEMIMDAVYSRLPTDLTLVDTGALRSDLIAAFDRFATELSGPVGIALRGLWADSLHDPELNARTRGYSRGGGIRMLRTLLTRAATRGEIDPAVITDVKVEAGPAYLRYRFLIEQRPLDITALVDNVLLPLFRT